jgi:hypothetical protein
MNSLINIPSASQSFLWPAFVLCPVPDLFHIAPASSHNKRRRRLLSALDCSRNRRLLRNNFPAFVPYQFAERAFLPAKHCSMANFLTFIQVKNPPAQAEEYPDKLIADCLINVKQGIERAKE